MISRYVSDLWILNDCYPLSCLFLTRVSFLLFVEKYGVSNEVVPALKCFVHGRVGVPVLEEDDLQVLVLSVQFVRGTLEVDVYLAQDAAFASGGAGQGWPISSGAI